MSMTEQTGQAGGEIGKVVASEPPPLPVFLLLDCSSSMADEGKIKAMNLAVREMLKDFAKDDGNRVAAIQVGVVRFGKVVEWVFELMPAREALEKWQDLDADGATPIGSAIKLVLAAIEDYRKLPKRAFKSNLILVTDGDPTDYDHPGGYQAAISELNASVRGAAAFRLGLAIGAGAKIEIIKEFLNKPDEQRVFQADSAWEISRFFSFTKDTILQKTIKPNDKPQMPDSLDDYKY
jgi:uncharacterized protein YegL